MNPRDLLDQLPDESLVPVSWVRELVAQLEVDDAEPLADLDVKQAAASLGRKPSTIRGLCASGRLEAYRLNNREWRITRQALRAFQDEQRQNSTNNGMTLRRGREVDLSAWRKVRKAAT